MAGKEAGKKAAKEAGNKATKGACKAVRDVGVLVGAGFIGRELWKKDAARVAAEMDAKDAKVTAAMAVYTESAEAARGASELAQELRQMIAESTAAASKDCNINEAEGKGKGKKWW